MEHVCDIAELSPCYADEYTGSSIVLGQPWDEVEARLIDSDKVVVRKPSLRLKIRYKLDEDIESLTLELNERRRGGGFTVGDIARHIVCVYSAYGEVHDAVLDCLMYDSDNDVYVIGCSS